MNLIQEILTALALLGTGGAIGSWLNDWRRNRREDRIRWHSERRSAYEKFLTNSEKLYDTELLIALHLGNLRQLAGWGKDPLFDEEYLLREAEKLDDDWATYAIEKVRQQRMIAESAREQMYEALAAIETISAPNVVDAARSYHIALKSLIYVAMDDPPRECGGWSDSGSEALELVTKTSKAFIATIRKELGVEG